jgi:hypothetical protein
MLGMTVTVKCKLLTWQVCRWGGVGQKPARFSLEKRSHGVKCLLLKINYEKG